MNEERFIEKLLQRYARKRREEAGPATTLHPATRRLLQAEVARHYGQTTSRTEPAPGVWARFWRGWGRPLAWATPVVVAGAVVFWALQPDRQPPPTEPSSVRAPLAQPPEPARTGPETASQARRMLAARKPESPSPAPSATSLEAKSPAAVSAFATAGAPSPAIAESLKALESPPPPPPPEQETALGARSLWEVPSRREPFLGELVEPDVAGLKASRPARLERSTSLATSARPDRSHVLAQAFVNAAQDETMTRSAPSSAADRPLAPRAGAATPVLARFQILQIGNQIQVLDADGSVYVAEVSEPASGGDRISGGAALGAGVSARASVSTSVATASQAGPAGAADVTPTPGWLSTNLLRAVGTNRTLNQQVEFVWNFAPLTNGSPTLGDRSQLAGALAAPQNFPLPPGVGVLGWARIGQTQQIQVRALPENSR